FEYDEENLKIKMELYFSNLSYMLYPYITIEDNLCSMNINVAEHPIKGFNYERINDFNKQSKFFKAYLTEEGIVSLEYRCILNEIEAETLDAIFDSLYAVETLIDIL
ncbi:MAG: YbjN domain-containing protein, partial [Anaeroplasmataceae bacterium]|nr:YbjN domain-containing protein [Anaeroplasmataceae bacterium]